MLLQSFPCLRNHLKSCIRLRKTKERAITQFPERKCKGSSSGFPRNTTSETDDKGTSNHIHGYQL
ncbi:hypothetical protein DPMN_038264 [Dreissena polymorpha]|uniref:Uncharacterized protein n=1 Tax=Dreissena polymorpha TaxID=45954 RepID=A0A9D4MF34_DREPO|nr:hypothetical protein DPMN_038264 [Dreissena polymorpha]